MAAKVTEKTEQVQPKAQAANAGLVYVGFDWGTNISSVKARPAGADADAYSRIVPTVVGYAAEGIIARVLPGDAEALFGEEALRKRLHLDLVWPLADGTVVDVKAARDFAMYLKQDMDLAEGTETRAVIGVPANVEADGKDHVRQALGGVFDRILLIPEPFLAALGYRDEARVGDADYVDPVQNSLFVDIGAGTTDISLVQGCYPTRDDQISFPFAGDAVDDLLEDGILQTYPDCALSAVKIREIKEALSYVGVVDGDVTAGVMVAGKPRTLELSGQIKTACEALLAKVYDGVTEMIARADSDSVVELLRNIVITGGGSLIRNIATELQARLAAAGYETPQVRCIGANYKEFVAAGAVKAALGARENQWQRLIA